MLSLPVLLCGVVCLRGRAFHDFWLKITTLSLFKRKKKSYLQAFSWQFLVLRIYLEFLSCCPPHTLILLCWYQQPNISGFLCFWCLFFFFSLKILSILILLFFSIDIAVYWHVIHVNIDNSQEVKCFCDVLLVVGFWSRVCSHIKPGMVFYSNWRAGNKGFLNKGIALKMSAQNLSNLQLPWRNWLKFKACGCEIGDWFCLYLYINVYIKYMFIYK